MNNNFYFVLILAFLLLHNFKSIAQLKEDKISLYETSMNFMKGKRADFTSTAVIKDQADNYIQIKNVVDSTNKIIKRWKSYWAVEYADNKYFNLGYSLDLNQWGTYVKFDIIGKYCAVFIDANSRKIVKHGGNNYGGDLTGVLLAGSNKWGKNWLDVNGQKKKILFIDTSHIEEGMFATNNSSRGNLLTREKLSEIMGNNYQEIDLKTVSFEKVVEIIKELNQITANKVR
jgi:hypothetical protein